MDPSAPYLSVVMMFAGNFAPQNWAFCDGKLMSIAENTALFSLIGTIYGGDGQVTFALPDFRGRIPVGTGNGPGLPSIALGEMAGTETVTLTVQNLPMHNHLLDAYNSNATANTPANNLLGVLATDSDYVASGPTVPMSASSIGFTGKSQAINNVQASLVINYIIAVEGIYPSRN